MYKKIKKIKHENPKYFYLGVVGVVAVLAIFGYGISKLTASDAPLVSSIELDPSLDLSRFASYDALASIDRLPQSETATVTLQGINGDGGDHWDHYVDGSPSSQDVVKNMTYDPSVSKWRSTNIYPDSIYPEIFFMPSITSWNNSPQNTIVRRNNYQLMHMSNPYVSTGDMSFWIEVNAYRQSQVNSANLQVYLVEKGHDLAYFQQDWRALPGVELVGTITKDATPNHMHTTNSSHHVVRLGSNPDGSFGVKNLDIEGDFWIILYSTSPNDDRGYNLRYQPSSLCNNNNRWYSGSQSGWTTTLQSGCPDAHIHVARRSTNGGIRDGVKATVSASYQGETGTKVSTFYYDELPNLPPNATVFRNPVLGGTYAGEIEVNWDPATDPNNDPLKYTINLYDTNNLQVGDALISDTSSTGFTFATNTPDSEIPNGEYYLKGQVCDQGVPTNEPPDAPLCTEFEMPRTFTIDNSSQIRSVNSVSIASNNANPAYAKAGDTVTLSFATSASMNAPTVGLYSGGHVPINDISLTTSDNINWTARYLVSSSGIPGEVSFEIGSSLLDKDYYETTDGTKVTVDNVAPTIATYSPVDGSDGAIANTDLVLTFQENVQAISGKNLIIKKVTDDSTIDTIALDSAQVTVNGPTLTLNPSSNLDDKTDYYILIDPGAFKDIAGNLYSGITDNSTWNFTVGDITKPVLSSARISSNNSNTSYASVGDVITLLFESNEPISAPSVVFKLNGSVVSTLPVITNTTGNFWKAEYTVVQGDPEGLVTFTINFSDIASNVGAEVDQTSDNSSVTVTHQAVPTSTTTMQISPTQTVTTTLTATMTAILTKTPTPTEPTRSQSDARVTETPTETAGSVKPVDSISVQDLDHEDEYGDVIDLFTLKLKIIDGKKPLAGAKVELYSTVRESVTDIHGEASFANVEAGVHKIKIYRGKQVVEREVSVIGDNTKDLNITINLVGKKDVNWMLWISATLAFIALILFLAKRIYRTR